MPGPIEHHAMLACGIAVVAAACSAGPAAPPLEAGGSSGVPAAGGDGAGSGGMVSSPDGAGGTAGQGATGGLGGAAGSAGTGAGGSGGGATVTFAQISTLIPGACGGTECHTGTQELSLRNDARLHRTLLDTVVAECGGAHLVVPGDPERSAIIQLVNRRCTKLGMPFYMPKDCARNPCLPSSQIQTITSWIQAGAPGP